MAFADHMSPPRTDALIIVPAMSDRDDLHILYLLGNVVR